LFGILLYFKTLFISSSCIYIVIHYHKTGYFNNDFSHNPFKNLFTILFIAFSIMAIEIKRDWSNTIDKKKLTFIAIGFILIATAIAYYPCINNGFVWDDEGYILKNPYIKHMSLDNLKTIMTTQIMENYHPITIISYAWEYFFFKLDPAPYHIVNIVIHLLNCVLVFYLILRAGGGASVAFITALLFGIHPFHVESVAWISERKDVLYAFFYLVSLICYISYLNKEYRLQYYVYALFFFLLSLLSKPMAVTLPLILFLFDYFHNRKLDCRSFFEKIPFFILSVLSGIITLFVQKMSKNTDPTFAFPRSIFVACKGLVFYLSKTVLPTGFAALYHYPTDNNLFLHIDYLVAPIIVLALALLAYYSTRYTKKVAWGGLFYVITLLPVIQLLPIGLAFASDRYTYVPLIGIFYIFSVFVVWVWQNKLRKHRYLKIIAVVLSFILIVQLIVLTRDLCKVWKDSMALWSNVVKQYPQTDVAYNNRGIEYSARKEYDKALDDFFTAVKLNPQYAAALSNICNIYSIKEYNEKALPYCLRAIKINPRESNAYVLLGDIYWSKDTSLSIEMFKKSISLSSHYYTGYLRLCNSFISLKQYDEAYPVCFTSIEYNPEDAVFCADLGNTYLHAGQYNRALSFYLQALLINPNLPGIHNNLAVLYYYLNDFKSSIKHFNTAVSLGQKVDPEFQKLIEEHQRKMNGLK
jgi:protein O-mannosyl-transferase